VFLYLHQGKILSYQWYFDFLSRTGTAGRGGTWKQAGGSSNFLPTYIDILFYSALMML
jgi:hypothetical protein